MDLPLIISSVLIILGATLMLANIMSHRRIVQEARLYNDSHTKATRILSRIHLVFMAFFFIGYVAVLYFSVNQIEFASDMFVAVIFFFGAVFVAMGIVIQKRMMSELRRNNAKLHEYNARLRSEQSNLLELNRKLETEVANRVKAEEADQMKSDFLSLVSHELRTPLTSIFGFTKLIEKGITGLESIKDETEFNDAKERLNSNLTIVCDECSRLTRLINNVLDLAKIESGRMEWIDKPHSLSELVQSSLAATKGLLFQKTGVSTEVVMPTDPPDILVDADHFTLMLVNLINNAIKFTDHGVISIIAEVHSDSLTISIKDQGRGIDLDNVNNIFDKFFIVRSGDTLGGKQMGTGLGLPICKEIVEHYKGNIRVESTFGEGSTFHIEFPETIFVR